MAKYYATVTVQFSGYIEAENEDAAEQLAMTSWASDYTEPLVYESVVDVTLEEEDEEEAAE